jgi:hypothetical protein
MSAIIFLVISISGVNSLLLPASPLGLTSHFSASKDAEAIFYNPARFEAGENYSIWCSYNRFYLSMQSVSLALSKRIKIVDVGLAFINFDYGDIEQRPDYPHEDSLTYYSANDFIMVLGSSVNITSNGRIGLNLKYISENIYIYSDYALAVDLSFAYNGPTAGLSVGASNFGTQLTIKNEQVNLPARLSMGGFFILKKITTSADIHYLVNHGIFEYSVGVGLPVHRILNINAALHYRESVYAGFGFELKPGKIAFKYAGSFYPKDLGMVNTIGIGLDF